MALPVFDETARGVYVVLNTPFSNNGTLDLESVDRLVDFYSSTEVRGLGLLGLVGETTQLSLEEALTLTKRVLQRVANRFAVIVNVAGRSPAEIDRLADEAMGIGAAGLMIAPISGLQTDLQVETHIADLLQRLDARIPTVLLGSPQSSAVRTSATVIGRLVTRFSNLKALKHEDCPGLNKLSALRMAEERGDRRRISILSGNHGLLLPMELARGADGAFVGTAYPEILVSVYASFVAGTPSRSEDIYDALLPVMRYENQPGWGLVIRKEILRRRGVIKSSRVRLRNKDLSPTDASEIGNLMQRLERRLRSLDVSLMRPNEFAHDYAGRRPAAWRA